MSAEPHLIVYAAPAHETVPAVTCSCGWSASGDDAGSRAHRDVMYELLARWLDHVEETGH